MQPAKRAYVKPTKPKNAALRRGVLFTVLTIFCVVCFWYAFSSVNAPPCPLSNSPASSDNKNTGCGTGSGGHARPSGLGAIASSQATDKRNPSTPKSATSNASFGEIILFSLNADSAIAKPKPSGRFDANSPMLYAIRA